MISVCMATYNGACFINQQLDSILIQLSTDDEIIISDDNSTDNTVELIQSYNDKRIKLIFNPNKGIISNFENALNQSSGEFIFLSDQDDVWCQGKVVKMIQILQNVDLIVTNAVMVDEYGNEMTKSYFEVNNTKPGFIRNIINPSYLGCAMAFKKEVKSYILPFPSNIPMHDIWIGSLVSLKGNVMFLKDKLILYRRHGQNASFSGEKSLAPLSKKISYRVVLLILLLKRILFYNKKNQNGNYKN
jgi:glycosyltransferase involved in cell wall biosynthesis